MNDLEQIRQLKKEIKYLESRKRFYKQKFEDKLSVDKEYQKLRRKFDDFLLAWIEDKKKYEKEIGKLKQAIK